jgi:hypothetical protein
MRWWCRKVSFGLPNAARLVESHIPEDVAVLTELWELAVSVAVVPVAVAVDDRRARRLPHIQTGMLADALLTHAV